MWCLGRVYENRCGDGDGDGDDDIVFDYCSKLLTLSLTPINSIHVILFKIQICFLRYRLSFSKVSVVFINKKITYY